MKKEMASLRDRLDRWFLKSSFTAVSPTLLNTMRMFLCG